MFVDYFCGSEISLTSITYGLIQSNVVVKTFDRCNRGDVVIVALFPSFGRDNIAFEIAVREKIELHGIGRQCQRIRRKSNFSFAACASMRRRIPYLYQVAASHLSGCTYNCSQLMSRQSTSEDCSFCLTRGTGSGPWFP